MGLGVPEDLTEEPVWTDFQFQKNKTKKVLDTDFTNKLTLSLRGRAKFKPIY